MEYPYCPGPGDAETWPQFTGHPNDPRGCWRCGVRCWCEEEAERREQEAEDEAELISEEDTFPESEDSL